MTILLDLLGTTVELSADDSRWDALLESLWRPFVVRAPKDAEAVPASVSEVADAWEFRVGDRPPLASPDPWLLANEIRHSLTEVALERATDLVDLHAAAVAREGVAVLIAGASGAGKTTMSMAFAARGWDLLGDDVAPLRGAGAVLPFPTPLGIKDKARYGELGPEGARRGGWPPPPEDTFLVPASAFGTPASKPADARFLAFVRFDPEAEPSLTRVSPGVAVVRCTELTRRTGPASLAVLSRLCERIEAVDLVYPSTDGGIATLESGLAEFPR